MACGHRPGCTGTHRNKLQTVAPEETPPASDQALEQVLPRGLKAPTLTLEQESPRQRLLHYLEAASSTYQQYVSRKRKLPFKQRPSYNLVHRVMPANILAEGNHLSARIKQRRGMQPPGAAEYRLLCP